MDPFVYQIRVGWADCDPARIAFTGRIPYFALEAIDAWWGEKTGQDWYRLNIDRNNGTPFVHLSMDFSSPVTPLHPLLCEVRLLRVGNSSVRFSVIGKQDGVTCFQGQFVSAFVESDKNRKVTIPDDIRAIIEPMAIGELPG